MFGDITMSNLLMPYTYFNKERHFWENWGTFNWLYVRILNHCPDNSHNNFKMRTWNFRPLQMHKNGTN